MPTLQPAIWSAEKAMATTFRTRLLGTGAWSGARQWRMAKNIAAGAVKRVKGHIRMGNAASHKATLSHITRRRSKRGKVPLR